MNYITPRVTHFPDVNQATHPLCGASVFDSITRSVQVCSTFSDCHRCLALKEGT